MEKEKIIYTSEVDTSDEAIQAYRDDTDSEDLDDETIIDYLYDFNRDDWNYVKEVMDRIDDNNKNKNVKYIIHANLGFWYGRKKGISPKIDSLRQAVCSCWGGDTENTFIVKENENGELECEYHHYDGIHYFTITRTDNQPINLAKEVWGL